MSARKPGWVTVAAAAAELTRAGDTIDASNVSRYLARNLDIPQEKDGKFRFVDLAALKAHRGSSLFVSDKRQARDLEPDRPVRTPVAAELDDAPDDQGPARGGSELQATNLELRQIELRRKRREEEVEDGRLIPLEELQTVTNAMMGAFVAELARQEQVLTAKLGREAGLEIRRAHRTARSSAAARLIEAAQQSLQPTAAAQLVTDAAAETAAA